ncbi:MAG: Asp-tRNA(Asn)/Glu-tRNA(Gln) amidotransferase subunit GatA [Patescibacteria group bacterium]
MLNELTIAEATDGLRKKKFSSVELTKSCLERIRAVDEKIHAFLQVDGDTALEAARLSDGRIGAGDAGPMTGIPLAVKDNMAVAGTRTTAGSKILENYTAAYDATVIAKLREAGAVFLGKTNMDEFAMGSSTETSAFGATKNPWDLSRVPGGSSGGSAAAVAGDMCLAALGSDTGGSIRQPAALTGCVGLKPSYGRVSRYGLLALASSLDQIGPFAKTVSDARELFNALIGKDPKDATTREENFASPARPKKGLKGMRLGIPKEYFVSGMDTGVESAVREAIAQLEGMGAEVKEVSLPHTEYALAVYYVLMPAEASSNLARYDGIRFGFSAPEAKSLRDVYFESRGRGFGREVRRRIMLGTYALSAGYYDAYYRKAQQVRTLVRRDFDNAFADVDCIVTPTSPTTAFSIGEKFDDPLTMYLSDIYTVSVNVAGLPAISVPCGFSESLPVGLQLIAQDFDEETLFAVASAYEAATEWHKQKPKL